MKSKIKAKCLKTGLLILGLIMFAEIQTAQAQNVTAIPLYRVYHGDSNIYTTDKNERDAILQIKNVAIADNGIAAYIFPKQIPGTVPLYRLQSKNDVTNNLYTISEKVKKTAMTKEGNFSDGGIIGYVSAVKTDDSVAFYQLYRPAKNTFDEDRLYTTDEKTKLSANSQPGKGKYEFIGVECYVWKTPVTYSANGKPVAPLLVFPMKKTNR